MIHSRLLAFVLTFCSLRTFGKEVALSTDDWRSTYESYVGTLKSAVNKLQNMPGFSDFVANTLTYHDVPLTWLPSIGKIFPGNYSDFIFVHQISHPLSLPMLHRVSNTFGELCKLSMCDKYFLLYSPSSCYRDSYVKDEQMLRAVLPDGAVVAIEQSSRTSCRSNDTACLNSTETIDRNEDRRRRVDILTSWFSSHQLNSGNVWVMQDDVGWVGDFSQILSLLQLSSKADYLVSDCSLGCLNNEDISMQCECDNSFVRYSRRLLTAMSECVVDEGLKLTSGNHLALQYANMNNFDVHNLKSLLKNVFAEEREIDLEAFMRYIDQYTASDWRDGVITLSPSRPVALIFRNILDTRRNS
jgi:hypothetical protein